LGKSRRTAQKQCKKHKALAECGQHQVSESKMIHTKNGFSEKRGKIRRRNYARRVNFRLSFSVFRRIAHRNGLPWKITNASFENIIRPLPSGENIFQNNRQHQRTMLCPNSPAATSTFSLFLRQNFFPTNKIQNNRT
jgi:hypothetical protein